MTWSYSKCLFEPPEHNNKGQFSNTCGFSWFSILGAYSEHFLCQGGLNLKEHEKTSRHPLMLNQCWTDILCVNTKAVWFCGLYDLLYTCKCMSEKGPEWVPKKVARLPRVRVWLRHWSRPEIDRPSWLSWWAMLLGNEIFAFDLARIDMPMVPTPFCSRLEYSSRCMRPIFGNNAVHLSLRCGHDSAILRLAYMPVFL